MMLLLPDRALLPPVRLIRGGADHLDLQGLNWIRTIEVLVLV